MEEISDIQPKTTIVQDAFDVMLKLTEGVAGKWFNASQIASLMSPKECDKLEKRTRVAADWALRSSLAQREVEVLFPNRKTSVEAAQAYKSAKERSDALHVAGIGALLLHDVPEAGNLLIQQADNGVTQVNYEEEIVRLYNMQVKDAMGNHCKAITNPSTNPEVIALEKGIKNEFGVTVNFGDNLDLARQTHEVCKKVRSLGHELPNEIILAETGESMCRGVTFFKSRCIIIANVDPNSVVFDGMPVVDTSFRGTLFHEIGHVNSENICFSEPSAFSKQLGERFNATVKEFVSGLPNNKDVLQKLGSAIAKNEYAGTIASICCGELSPEVMRDFPGIITSKLNEFVDQAEDCLGKRIAKEVSLYAAISELEFMAEVYCGLMLGKSYSQEIMGEYKKCGGQPFA
jgi:hypothetical protein